MNKDRLGDALTLISATKKLVGSVTPMDRDICFGLQKWLDEAARHIKVAMMDETDKAPEVTLIAVPEPVKEPAKKPYPVGSPEADEAVQRVKAQEQERMAAEKRRPGRPRKVFDE